MVRIRRLSGVLLIAVMLFLTASCSMLTGSSDTVERLNDKGYEAEQVDDNTFCVTENGITYYYDCWFNKPFFRKAVLVMETGMESGPEIEITISKEKNNRMFISYVRPHTAKRPDGTEYMTQDSCLFKFKKDFTDENLINNSGFVDDSGHYASFMGKYLTPEESMAIYDRGLQMEKEF